MKNFIIFLITGILCTHCTQKYIKMDKDNLHPTGQNATKGDNPPETASSTPAGTTDLERLSKELFEVLKGEYYFDDEDTEAFEEAFKKEIEKVLEEAKRKGIAEAVVNSVHEGGFGYTPLIKVSVAGNVGLMKLFLDAGAKVDMRAGELAGRETALHKAAYAGHTKAVELLVERGATIDAADNRGKTALHDAASEGHLEIVKLLVGKGANIEATDKRGKTALLYAVWYGHRDVVVYLLEEGANVEVKDKREYGVQEELEGIEDDEQKDKMEKLLRSYKKK